MTQTLTPPQVAEHYRVDHSTVMGWIRTGELRAINVGRKGARRPRYRIDPADLTAFEKGRQVVPPQKQDKRKYKPSPGAVQFY